MQVARRAPRALLAAVATAALAVPGLALAQDGTGGATADEPHERRARARSRQPQAPAQRSFRRAIIRAAQRALDVSADGVLGSRTRAAIRRFQRRNDLRVTGRLTARTLRALGVGTTAARPRAVADDSGATSDDRPPRPSPRSRATSARATRRAATAPARSTAPA